MSLHGLAATPGAAGAAASSGGPPVRGAAAPSHQHQPHHHPLHQLRGHSTPSRLHGGSPGPAPSSGPADSPDAFSTPKAGFAPSASLGASPSTPFMTPTGGHPPTAAALSSASASGIASITTAASTATATAVATATTTAVKFGSASGASSLLRTGGGGSSGKSTNGPLSLGGGGGKGSRVKSPLGGLGKPGAAKAKLGPKLVGKLGQRGWWRQWLGEAYGHLRAPGRRGEMQMRCFWLTFCAYGSILFLRKPLGVIKRDMVRELQVSLPAVSGLDTALLLPVALCQIFFTHWGDQIGPRRIVGWCLIGAALSMLLFGVVLRSYAVYVLLLSLNGAFQALVFPLCIKALSLWYPHQQKSIVFGVWGITIFLGGMVATTLAVYVREWLGWRQVFLFPSLLVGLLGVVVLRYLRLPSGTSSLASNLPFHGGSKKGLSALGGGGGSGGPEVVVHADSYGAQYHSDSESDGNQPAGIYVINSAPVVRNLRVSEVTKIKMVKEVAAAYFCVNAVRYCVHMWLPIFLATQVGHSVETAGHISLAFELGGLVGSPTLAILADRAMGGRKLLASQIALMISAVALFLFYGFSWSRWACLLTLFVAGAGNGGTDLILSGSVAVDLGAREDCVSSVSGFIGGVGILGAVVQGPLVGLATHQFQRQGVLVMMLLAVIPVVAVGRTKRLDRLAVEKMALEKAELAKQLDLRAKKTKD